MSVVAVVGGSLAGMAAAARLAKARHRVLLFEARHRLGGRWAAPGALPPAFTFPAPWRDLFRKSGRPFDAELARTGHALVPAPPALHHFADGSTLSLPSDRGEQWAALGEAWGTPAAERWRDLLDDLDERWQLLRRLGLEDEFTDAALTPRRRQALGLNRSVARLARRFGHPQAAALLRSTAWRIGSRPERTPEFVAVRLALERIFGRWQLTRDGAPVPASELIDLLAARLELRGVEVRTGEPVLAIAPGRVRTGAETVEVDAVVATVNPWEYLRLTGGGEPTLRRRTAWTRPAFAPQIVVTPDPGRAAEPAPESATATGARSSSAADQGRRSDTVTEDVHHGAAGVRVEYRLPGEPGQLVVHHFTAGSPDPAFGTRWTSPRSWLRQPPLRPQTPTVTLASASSRGGNDPWAQLLSAALATYVTHENLTGADIRPTNKAVRVR
ncbi:MAG: FAD-dependent oxidoreductase [Micropruina sp.]|uniref:FAD-dependent oxidoreductase n=1 Tax=Micropruina sp. TaxID=2737536 RepID=UPI0039E5BDBA